MAAQGPGIDAPAAMTVLAPDRTWHAAGTVTGRALYSVRVAWTSPAGEGREAWFVWEPGRPGHGKEHGVTEAFAMRVEIPTP